MGAKLLRGFAYVWFCLTGGLIFVSCLSIRYTGGFAKVQEVFSPFNLINFAVTVITLSPGIGAYVLAEKLEERSSRRSVPAAKAQLQPDIERVEAVVQSYGAALEAAAATKALVVDSSRLPAPKERIKAALLVALRATTDPNMQEQIKIAYLELSAFQLGVGTSPVDFAPSSIPDPNDREAIVAAARSVAELGTQAEHWSRIASEEREQLVEELRHAGFWRPAV